MPTNVEIFKATFLTTKARNQSKDRLLSLGPWHFAGQESTHETPYNEYLCQDTMEDTTKGERRGWQSRTIAVLVCLSFHNLEPWPPPAAMLTALGGRDLWGGVSDGTHHLRAVSYRYSY